MGKYSKLSRQVPPKPRPWRIHPIWRGIGCILLLIGPVIAYISADLIVRMDLENGWYPIPRELARPLTIAPLRLTLPHLYANLMVTALLLLLGFALIMVFYALIYAVLGPKKYGPLDAPPIRGRTRPSR